MRIGIPKALLYYQYGALWSDFFKELNHEVVISGNTDSAVLQEGVSRCIDECCVPLKVYLGHVAKLRECCDCIFVPRYSCDGPQEEYCPRFWGLPDIVRVTFPDITVLTCNLQGYETRHELRNFMQLGNQLGHMPFESLKAFHKAKKAQTEKARKLRESQEKAFRTDDIQILLVGQPYILRDSFLGGPMVRMIHEMGASPVFSDDFDKNVCRSLSDRLSKDLYWSMNKEIIGAIPLLKNKINGIILVTSFPCGTDSLVHELVLRRVKDNPIIHIVLDEQQGEAGLQTRLECFIDILKERSTTYVK